MKDKQKPDQPSFAPLLTSRSGTARTTIPYSFLSVAMECRPTPYFLSLRATVG
jgi:hypothetical protein